MTASSLESSARTALAGTRFGDVRWLAETGSTNTDVVALARAGTPEGACVVADHQSAGRGRLGRSWEAPAGGSLLCTVLLRPPAERASLTTLAVAVAASDAVGDLTGCTPRLKWPNDLVWPGDGSVPDRKLAGILAEAEPAAGGSVAVAVGMGMNVAWGSEVPAELVDIAVALDHITDPAPPPGRLELLVSFLGHLDETYGLIVGDGPGGLEALLDRWRGRSATLGRTVRVDLGGEVLEGQAIDLTPEGHLVVESAAGARTVAAGDVVHLRSA